MTSFAFPRRSRIRERAEFLACYEGGGKYHSPRFILFCLPKTEGEPRVGVAASRKTGGAVVRNRIKRVLREFFRLNFFRLPLADIVVVAKKDAGFISFNDARTELLPLIERARARIAGR